MALTWDITKCKDVEVIKDGEEWAVTETLIWMTMATGIGELTEKTLPEFYARVKLLEAIDGVWLRKRNKETGETEDYHLTVEDVRKRIGLVTNVFPQETRAKWLKRQVGRMLDEYQREVEVATVDA